MNKITLNVPEVTKDGKPILYLSQWEGFELPKGILAKGGTGVGGSTLAIDSKYPYIITVPTTALIQNKQEQHDRIYAEYSGAINYYSLEDYLVNTETPTFMVTYDSLSKLVTKLQDLGVEPYKEYRLLVDEYTELLKAYSYRNKAINSLLREADSFEYVTYMSATPIPFKFTPKVFECLDYTELIWKNVIQIKPIIHKTTKPYHSVSNILKLFKANGYSHKIGSNTTNELFIFVNSVIAIRDIIDNTNLTPNEVKVICSDTEPNREILNEFAIDKPTGDNKPINFLTSKVFSGCDIHSNSGLSIVVSNVRRRHTLVDIATDLYQIAGRIRNINNPFKSTIIHIYNTGAADMTKAEFDKWILEKKQNTLTQIDIYNNLDILNKKALRRRMELSLEDDYLIYNEEKNELEYDYLKEMSEAFDFSVTNDIYANGFSVRQAYLKEGYDVESSQERARIEEAFVSTATKASFKQQLQEYCKLQKELEKAPKLIFDNNDLVTNPLLNEIQNSISSLEKRNPLFSDAYKILGANGIETKRYSKASITQAIYEESNEAKEVVKHSIFTKFKLNGFYSSSDIIKAIQEVYDMHKIKKKARSADILDFLPAASTVKKVNGKPVRGYEVNFIKNAF